MKTQILVKIATAILIAGLFGSCSISFIGGNSPSDGTDPGDGTSPWDGTDYSSNTLLQGAPTFDLATYDVFLQSLSAVSASSVPSPDSGPAALVGSEGSAIDVSALTSLAVGDWSVGAGFAKALRNRAIDMSRKADYAVGLIQALDTAHPEVDLTDGTHYFELGTVMLPFIDAGHDGVMRVVVDEASDRIAVDVAFSGSVKLQIYTDGGNDGDAATQVAQAWMDLQFGSASDWERQWIQVDTMDGDVTDIQFTQTGAAAVTADTDLRYNYTGSLVKDQTGAQPFNIARGAFHEDFTGGEDFAYTVQYESRFNNQYGSTVAYQNHLRPDGQDTYGPEAWSTTTNKVVDHTDATFTTYFGEIQNLTSPDLPDISDPTAGLAVGSISATWAGTWDGTIPADVTPTNVPMDLLPVEIEPVYQAWDKYDDLTAFTNLPNEDPAQIFSEID